MTKPFRVPTASMKYPPFAVFSTDFGARAPRRAPDFAQPLVVRSTPTKDCREIAAGYCRRYSRACAEIGLSAEVEEYFDAYDIQLSGRKFLVNVLAEIRRQSILKPQPRCASKASIPAVDGVGQRTESQKLGRSSPLMPPLEAINTGCGTSDGSSASSPTESVFSSAASSGGDTAVSESSVSPVESKASKAGPVPEIRLNEDPKDLLRQAKSNASASPVALLTGSSPVCQSRPTKLDPAASSYVPRGNTSTFDTNRLNPSSASFKPSKCSASVSDSRRSARGSRSAKTPLVVRSDTPSRNPDAGRQAVDAKTFQSPILNAKASSFVPSKNSPRQVRLFRLNPNALSFVPPTYSSSDTSTSSPPFQHQLDLVASSKPSKIPTNKIPVDYHDPSFQARTLHVGGLPHHLTEWDLSLLFGIYGFVDKVAIRAKVWMLPYAFVTYATHVEALTARRYLNGFVLGKTVLDVQFKMPTPAPKWGQSMMKRRTKKNEAWVNYSEQHRVVNLKPSASVFRSPRTEREKASAMPESCQTSVSESPDNTYSPPAYQDFPPAYRRITLWETSPMMEKIPEEPQAEVRAEADVRT